MTSLTHSAALGVRALASLAHSAVRALASLTHSAALCFVALASLAHSAVLGFGALAFPPLVSPCRLLTWHCFVPFPLHAQAHARRGRAAWACAPPPPLA